MNGQQTYAIVIKARLRLDEGEFDPEDRDYVVEVIAAVTDAIENTDIEIEPFDEGESEEGASFVLLIDDVKLVRPEDPAVF
jgi:hypothetical protein